MGKLTVLIVVILLGVLALFAVYNNDTTGIVVPFDKVYEIPKIGVILISCLFGALSTLVIFMARDTRRFMISYQYQKERKRDEKVEGFYAKGLNAILADDDNSARAALENVIKLEPSHVDALLRLGNMDVRKERYEQAIDYYKRAHMVMPSNLEVMFSLADVLHRTNKVTEAIAFIDKVLEVDSDNLSALMKKRKLLEDAGMWDELIEVQKYIVKYTTDEKVKKREESNLLGYKYEVSRDSLEKGDVERANKGFRTILKEGPQFVPAYLGVAEVMLSNNETEDTP
ncbi:tetratricopeptide repeat protein [Nitrospirota bacterium]